MKRFFVAICALALTALAANADVPDPSTSQTSLDQVQRILLIPDGLGDVAAATFTVTVRNSVGNPINNSIVEILIGGQGVETDICSGQILQANTNPSGIVTFNIAGGGCLKSAGAGVIRASGVTLRTFNAVMSPDYAGSDNVGQPNRWSNTVSAVDLAAFVVSYQGGTGPASCHDYDNSGLTNAPDLATFVNGYKGGANFCN